jgi:hypothetical protein
MNEKHSHPMAIPVEPRRESEMAWNPNEKPFDAFAEGLPF